MANYGFCLVIFRILLPILITLCIIFRPCGVSVVYLFLLLYFPMVPVPTSKTMSGHTGIYLKVLMAISILMGIAQVAFQFVLLAKSPYGEFLNQTNSTLEKALRHGGFVSLANAEAITVVTWVYPEVLMILTSVCLYCVFRKITTDIPPEGSEETPLVDPEKPVKRNFNLLITIGRYVVLLVLCLAAVLRPSIVGGFYFLVFLSSATWWACYKQLRKRFAIFLRCLMFVVFVHILAFYVYQFQWIQEFVPEDNRYARYFGLKILLNVTGVNGDDRIFEWGNQEIATYFLPFTLFCLYYVLALESKFLLKPQSPKKLGPFSRLEGSFNTGSLGRQMSQRLSSRQLMRSATTKRRWQSATRKVRAKTTVDPEKITESTPLIRGVSPTRRYGSGKKNSSILQDSTGSVTVTGENTEDIPMEQLEDEYIPNVFEKVMFVLESLLQVIIRSSYIATNIIMMAWSITYISWITFVLLLWANLLWLIPNQRKSMLNSSPFLVIYAWFLLISAYIYSMELNDDELPSSIDRFNLKQIGFMKVLHMPCNPLLVKCLFTCMFWITLRQYMQERLAEKQSSALADMVAPLQVTVGTATGVNKEQEKSNKIMEKLGHYLKAFLTRFWIWIVAAVLFAVAITGEKMTLFRIFYMALFLFFILTFQLSFKFWRRMMFGFWLTVIIYSMIILIMVYTYQFDDFPKYWAEYLKVRTQLQEDIGLEVFDVKDLFVRLATPTCFVIITVIQLHYFHKDFMLISDPKTTVPITNTDLENSSLQGGHAVEKSSEKDITTTSSIKFDVSELEHMSTEQFRRVCLEFLKKMYYGLNLLCLFLEIHMPKVVLFFAMVLAVYDRSAFYFVVVVLLSLSLVFGRPLQMFAMYSISVLVSVFLLARMIYQIEYIKQEDWDVTCNFTNGTSNITETQNIAEWLGFRKVVKQGMLSHLLKWQILYIVIVTFYVVILVRQYNYRLSRGKPSTRAFFMFPRITRKDADNDLSTHIKYLLNYGFYKLGVEVCLVATAILIGIRMDMYSVIYSIWLAILFNLSRRVLSKIWPFYLVFIAIFLVIQYFMVIGLPPSLCIELPWDFGGQVMVQLRDWAFLLCSQHPPHAAKLLCDFVLLLLVSRQYVVFRIENRYHNQEYAGGSNESIIHLYEDKNFVNPVPDFVTYVRSYLDVFKRSVLMSFLWITLAVVFLSGTNRINIFSLGYMIGAFVFLWHGTDLYLRPIPGILRLWNWLLGYNVFVILAKSTLQIAGCIFLSEFSKETCWVGTVFGIGCVRRFGNPETAIGLVSPPKRCPIPKDFVGLAWDVGCFGFLIMQKRIFNSFNFFHMINEIKATTILASRGAELIEELRVKTTLEQDEREKRVLEKIKAKMDRIKATQQKIQGATYKDTTNHDVDTIYSGRRKYRRKPPKTYKQAIRSGDYYMFDDLDDEEIDLIDDVGKTPEEDEALKSKKQNVSEIDEHPKSVTIKDKDDSEPKPSTSKDDEDLSDISEPKEYTLGQRIIQGMLFIWVFVESCMLSFTMFLNRRSKDYRYIMKVLTKEKKIMKETTNYTDGLRVGNSQKWHPANSYHNLLAQVRIPPKPEHSDSEDKPPISSDDESDTKALATPLPSEQYSHQSLHQDPQELLDELEQTEMSSYDQPTYIRLLLAVWVTFMSRSELLCFFVIFLAQISTNTFMSLPLPLMVFFWGSLTVPRPSKTFWITLIAYVEIIVLIKYCFQFKILAQTEVVSDDPQSAIGIDSHGSFANWDLITLLVIFFHRFILKSLGLWKTSTTTVAVLTSGQYKVSSDGKLTPITSSNSDQDPQQKYNNSGRYTVSRKSSDSQQLVDDDDDDDQLEDEVDGAVNNKEKHSIQFKEESEQIVSVEAKEVTKFDTFTQGMKQASSKYSGGVKSFFKQLMDPTSRVAADVYSLMFLCDFFNFFVILFGFSAFGTQQDDEGVSSYLEENRVPVLFLLMLILQFFLIIIDRGIYLRKNIVGKLFFQIIQIILLHIWLFVLYPIITDRKFNSAIPPQLYYMVKCFYFLISAYQIRCGYPTRILGNFLCKGYGYVNMILYKVFMAIPFLFELRTVMDWMWTDTSMTVFDWIKMEDIFSQIFMLKCNRTIEEEYPQERGEKKGSVVKYVMGGLIILCIIVIIWFPLVFFALGNAVGNPNIPYEFSMSIRIGPYEPVYEMTAVANSIFNFTKGDQGEMERVYSETKKDAISFIQNYDFKDIAGVKFSDDSANIWSISPPDRKRMVQELNSTHPVPVRLEIKISHKTSLSEDSPVIITESNEVELQPSNEARVGLLAMLQGNYSVQSVTIQYIIPKFLKVTNKATAKPVSKLMYGKFPANSYRDITLKLSRNNVTNNTSEYWTVSEKNTTDKNYKNLDILSNLPLQNYSEPYLVIYTFNDKIFSSSLNFITGPGIIGVYTTLILVASNFLKGFFTGQFSKIMFDDLPYVDRLLQLCLDIYLVREAHEYILEEDLFAKLVFLFRSPETLIKWSRPKEEVDDDDDPEAEEAN